MVRHKGHKMFKSLKISNYKNISELEVDKIPQILLVGGKNNAGKSTLLEAIFLAMDRLSPDLISRHFSWRGIGQIMLDPDYWWRPSFHNYDFSNNIKISLEDDRKKWLHLNIGFMDNYTESSVGKNQNFPSNFRIQQNVTNSAPAAKALKITTRYADRDIQESYLVMQQQGAILRVRNSENTATIRPAIYVASTTRTMPHEDAARYSRLDLENNTASVLEAIKIIEPRVQSLSVVALGDQATIHASIAGFSRKVPVSFMGDGATRLISMVLAIITTPKGVILIDEIENGIHHSKLADFWKVIQNSVISAGSQLIATTHSYECLSAAASVFEAGGDESFSYIRLDRSKNSAMVKMASYSSQELKAALDAEYEVR
jgi:AAA15 family ATPase/GTPase